MRKRRVRKNEKKRYNEREKEIGGRSRILIRIYEIGNFSDYRVHFTNSSNFHR